MPRVTLDRTSSTPPREHRRGHATSPAEERSRDGGDGHPPLTAAILRLQHVVGNRAVRQLIEGDGAPLDAETRHSLEQFFGCDLASVRIRTGGAADSMCQAVGSDAFAVGDDVVVRTDRVIPSAAAQRHLVAHEVAHIVQQRQGPVEGAPSPAGIGISERSDRFEQEAESAATRFAARHP